MTSSNKSTATLIHLSSLTQYVIPFGNYIFPILLWNAKKNESEFIDYNGKQVMNFQISIFIYTIALCIISIPLCIYALLKNLPVHISNHYDFTLQDLHTIQFDGFAIVGIIAAALVLFVKIMEFVLIIYAALKTSKGDYYRYPLSISFFK